MSDIGKGFKIMIGVMLAYGLFALIGILTIYWIFGQVVTTVTQ